MSIMSWFTVLIYVLFAVVVIGIIFFFLFSKNKKIKKMILNSLAIAFVILVILAVWIPSMPSPHYQGNAQVSEAYSIFHFNKADIEEFYGKNGRMPDLTELNIKNKDWKYVEKMYGNNPYFALMKNKKIYPDVRGTTVGFKYDPDTKKWDECTDGTVERKFKIYKCRRN